MLFQLTFDVFIFQRAPEAVHGKVGFLPGKTRVLNRTHLAQEKDSLEACGVCASEG
jgi:hypothetical protein